MSIVRCRRKTETRKSSLFSHPLNESQTRRFVKFSQNQNIFSVYNLKFSSFFRIEILIHHFIHSFSMRCVVLYVCLPPNANAHVADHSVLMTANPFLNIVLFWLCVVCVARLTLSNQFFLFFFLRSQCVRHRFQDDSIWLLLKLFWAFSYSVSFERMKWLWMVCVCVCVDVPTVVVFLFACKLGNGYISIWTTALKRQVPEIWMPRHIGMCVQKGTVWRRNNGHRQTGWSLYECRKEKKGSIHFIE